MTGTLEERVDLLTVDCLALEIALSAIVGGMTSEQRVAALAASREVIDALSAHHKVTERGLQLLPKTGEKIESILNPNAQPTTPQADP